MDPFTGRCGEPMISGMEPESTRIHIVLLGMPTMLREIVRTVIEEAPEMDVIAVLPSGDLRQALDLDPDVLISGGDEADAFLKERCAARAIAISDDGRTATLCEMRPHRESLAELSAERLAEVIRGAR